jgi:hypothetical protein
LAKDIINDTHVMKLPHKLKRTGSRASGELNMYMWRLLEDDAASRRGQGSNVSLPPYLPLSIFPPCVHQYTV